MEKDIITLDILTERPVARNDELSEQDIVVQISSRQEIDNEVTVPKFLNLCIVLDRSGSMQGEKLETAKRSCIDVFNRLRTGDLFTVIVFDDLAEVIVNPQAPKGEVVPRINSIISGGSTNLSLGWYSGLQELQTYKTENYINRLILLSDGQANQGERKKNVLAKESAKAKELGITTSTIGIGSDFMEDLLEVLASESGGRFWYIQDNKIEDIINEEFKGSLSVVMERPRVELTLPKGIKIVKELNDLKIISGKYRIRPIASNDLFNFALRIEINPGLVSSNSASLKASLYDGEDFVSELEKEILLKPAIEYVTSEENPLVKSVVKQYEMSATDEEMIKKMDEGDMLAMGKLMEEERGAMSIPRKMLQDKLKTGQEYDELLREFDHLDQRDLENQNMLAVLHLLRSSQQLRVDGLIALQLNDLITRLRKTLMYRMHGEKGRRYSNENDERMQKDLLKDSFDLASDLMRRFPDNTDIREARGEIYAQLEGYK